MLNMYQQLPLLTWAGVLILAGATTAIADEEGFVPLFNGRDLNGWVNVNCAPNTFSVSDGMIVSTGVPTGIMRTEKQYENFILELEWKHLKAGGNAGLFIWSHPLTAPGVPFARSIEVQILDGRNSESYTSHGDVFSIHGATMKPDRPHPNGAMRCLPSEWRCKPAGEWNHYRVSCQEGRLELAVNGKVVSGGSQCQPRKGYLCLESEGSPVHFRNLRIKELPTTGAPDSESAPPARSYQILYTGIDLSGWRDGDAPGGWQANDWRLVGSPSGDRPGSILWTSADYGDVELIFDCRVVGQSDPSPAPLVLLRGATEVGAWPDAVRQSLGPPPDGRSGHWHRYTVVLKGSTISVTRDDQALVREIQLESLPARGPIGLRQQPVEVEFASLFVRSLD